MPWLLPALAAAQVLGVILADRNWLSSDAAQAIGVAALVGSLFVFRRARGLAFFSGVLAFAAGGLAMATNLEAAESGRLELPFEGVVEGTIHSVARGWGGSRIDLVDVTTPAEASVPSRIRLFDSETETEAGLPALERRLPGERILAAVRLRAPRSLRNPGSHSTLDELRRAGIGGQGRLTHPALHVRLPQREKFRPLASLHARRARWGDRIADSGPGGGLLRALALGDRSSLRVADREAFARLGISHLLAVSGLHLALVASLAYGLARAGSRRFASLAARRDTRMLALAVGLFAACGYAAVSGWGVPVRRALVLFGGLVLAFAGGRPRAALPLLAAAVSLILAADPADLFRPGAQLSFAASCALAAAARRETQEPPERSAAMRALRGALRATSSAVAVTAPLAAWHLGRSAPYALGVNLVAIPWTAFVMLPAAAVSLGAAALPVGESTDAVLGWSEKLAQASLSIVQAIATELPVPPPAARFSAPVWGSVAALALLSLGLRSTRARVLLAIVLTGVIAVAPPVELDPGVPRLVLLEVGQGDAILVETPTSAVLIDAGTSLPGGSDRGAQVVVPALAALGIRVLDLVVVTHADLDHRGGIPSVLRAVPVREVWLPYGATSEPGFDAVRAAARERDVPIRLRGAASPALRIGDLQATPLWPPREGGASRNNRSLVLRIDVPGRSILLPGDIEAAAEAALVESGAALQADVLALPHHGSRTSSSAAFLDAVDPEIAIVSAPCEGRFGMPHAPVLQRLRERSLTLWWTGRDGAVMLGLTRPLTAAGSEDPAAPAVLGCERPLSEAVVRYDARGVAGATGGVHVR